MLNLSVKVLEAHIVVKSMSCVAFSILKRCSLINEVKNFFSKKVKFDEGFFTLFKPMRTSVFRAQTKIEAIRYKIQSCNYEIINL